MDEEKDEIEYNGTKFSFLGEINKKFVAMTQCANAIINTINNNNEHSYDFSKAIAFWETNGWDDLDQFCSDYTLGHHLLLRDRELDTPENRELFYLHLRNHILDLEDKGEV